MQDFTASLPMMLYRALHNVMPRFRAIFAEHGLTEPQWRVLRVLWEREQIAQGELAELTLIPPPSLVGVLDRLARDGLVQRRRSSDDRRNVWISPTAAGRALQTQVMPAVEAAYAELRGSLDNKTWAALKLGLAALAVPPAAPKSSS